MVGRNYRLQDIQLTSPARLATTLFEIRGQDPGVRLSGTTHLPPLLAPASLGGRVGFALRKDGKSHLGSHGGLARRGAKGAEAGPQAPNVPVVIGSGSHPFPFRTRKLSLIPPMVLHGKLCGRVGRCRHYSSEARRRKTPGLFLAVQ